MKLKNSDVFWIIISVLFILGNLYYYICNPQVVANTTNPLVVISMVISMIIGGIYTVVFGGYAIVLFNKCLNSIGKNND